MISMPMLNLNVSENAMLRTVRHVGQNGTAMYTMCTQAQTMSIFMIIFLSSLHLFTFVVRVLYTKKIQWKCDGNNNNTDIQPKRARDRRENGTM